MRAVVSSAPEIGGFRGMGKWREAGRTPCLPPCLPDWVPVTFCDRASRKFAGCRPPFAMTIRRQPR
jgi:hypothetical protein